MSETFGATMNNQTLRDRVSFRSSLEPLRQPSFGIIGALQDHTADVQLESLALTLVLLCEGTGMDAHDLITRAKRQTATSTELPDPILEAIRDYAAGELT